LQKALSLDPKMADAYAALGQVHWNRYYYGWAGELRNLDDAEANYRTALNLNPTMASAHGGLALVAYLRGRCEDCLKEGRKIESTSLEDASSLLERARAYRYGGLVEKALPLLQRLIELDPANQDAYLLLTPAYGEIGRTREAIETAETVLSKFGERARTHMMLGFANGDLDQLEEARNHYQKAIELAPDDFPVYRFLGALLKRSGNPKMARDAWERGLGIGKRLLSAYPHNPRLRTSLAILYGYLGNKPGLLSEEARVLNDEPDNGLLLSNLASAHAALGDSDRAVELFRQALRLGFNLYQPGQTLWTSKEYGLGRPPDTPAYRDYLAELSQTVERLRSEY
jgi:tetratricopeptide (TPR) repeat protein